MWPSPPHRPLVQNGNAQLSALLDAVEAGEEVVITRCGFTAHDWPARLRSLHGDQPTLRELGVA